MNLKGETLKLAFVSLQVIMNYEYDASWKLYGDQWINDDKCYIISMMINVIHWILKSMNQWW